MAGAGHGLQNRCSLDDSEGGFDSHTLPLLFAEIFASPYIYNSGFFSSPIDNPLKKYLPIGNTIC